MTQIIWLLSSLQISKQLRWFAWPMTVKAKPSLLEEAWSAIEQEMLVVSRMTQQWWHWLFYLRIKPNYCSSVWYCVLQSLSSSWYSLYLSLSVYIYIYKFISKYVHVYLYGFGCFLNAMIRTKNIQPPLPPDIGAQNVRLASCQASPMEMTSLPSHCPYFFLK